MESQFTAMTNASCIIKSSALTAETNAWKLGWECRDGMEHKQCRTDLLKWYKKHITACRSLDKWVWEWHREVLLVGKHYLEL